MIKIYKSEKIPSKQSVLDYFEEYKEGLKTLGYSDSGIPQEVKSLFYHKKGTIEVEDTYGNKSNIVESVLSLHEFEFSEKTESEIKQEESEKKGLESKKIEEQKRLDAQKIPSPDYAIYRQEEYVKNGLTFERFQELTIEEDDTGLAEYRSKREEIKLKFPKPI